MAGIATARRGRRLAASIAIASAVVTAGASEAPAQLLNLDELYCELDPALDYCIARQLGALAESLDPSAERDKAALFAFVGKYLTHRTDDDIRLFPPEPGYYAQFTSSNQIDYVIYILDLTLNPYREATLLGTPNAELSAERIAEADLRLGEMEPGLPRLLAYRYMAEAHLRFGDPAAATTYVATLADEIAAIESRSARIPYLSDLGWLQARAGMADEALATAAEIVAIADTHPIAQLRPVFALEAAAAEGLAGGTELGVARLAAAQEAMDALAGAPPGFVALTTAMLAKNYGRLGLLADARPLVERATGLIDDVEPDQRPDFLRLLMEAGIH